MSEVEEKTEFKTDEKSLADRDEKGLFQPGCTPGPGRGKKKNSDIELTGELLSDIEAVVLAAMGDSDTGLRLKAAALAVKLQNLKKSEDSGPLFDPWVEKLIAFLNDSAFRYSHKTGRPTSALEMVDLLPRLCADCERLGGPVSDFKVVEDDD